MYVKVNKSTLKVVAITPEKEALKKTKDSTIVYNPNVTTTNINYVYAVRNKDGSVSVYEKITEEKVKTDQQIFLQKKKIHLENLSNLIKNYIERFYPEVKQRSDMADKEYCGSILLNLNTTYTTDQIYKDCANYASQILAGTSDLQTIVSSFPATEQPYWEQLIKVAVRIGWVNQVKQVYRRLRLRIEQATDISQLPYLPNEESLPKYVEV